MAGLRWRIGDGQSVNVRPDPWLLMPYHFKVRTPSPLLPERVSDLIDPTSRQWDMLTGGPLQTFGWIAKLNCIQVLAAMEMPKYSGL
ncbi:hypothetical protein Pyn_03667 [Prunus yedoensis var. nudiflora]|uniref:Uncharacterized protein n=1 Tax=Prunus yedoensis var. nudiflora TaxID=2094558 RepID=A0A314UFR1_PRUYE|nr:hypothetical protein Pyn_03667 [Prunus yedoensis var. nudiflora]